MTNLYKWFVIAGAIGLLAPRQASAHTGGVFTSQFGTPTVDGIQGAGEWTVALEIPVFTDLPGSLLFVMNDNANLYLGLSVVDGNLSNDDIVQLRFDDEHNGLTDVGDDGLSLPGNSSLADVHRSTTAFEVGDAEQHGTGAAGHAAGRNFFELSHPLNSGDVNDFDLAAGDTLGFAVRYFLNGTASGTGTTFPQNSFLAANEQSLYADLAIVPEPVTWFWVLCAAVGLSCAVRQKRRG